MAGRALPLRWSFVLILVGGAIVPMGVLGFWLTRSAARSGEELLRARLEESLLGMAIDVGTRWIEIRSGLLDVADHPSLLAALSSAPGGAGRTASADLTDGVGRLAPLIARLGVHDLDGAEVARLHPESDAESVWEPWVEVYVGVAASPSGDPMGTLRARVLWSALTRGRQADAGAANAVLGVVSSVDGRAIVPPPFDPALIAGGRFVVGEEPWVGTTRTVAEPPLELVTAAPLGPFQEPFLQATRRGTLALVFVALGSVLLVGLVTTRVTWSLGRLAAASEAVAAGDLSQHVPEHGPRELVHVAAAFNAMTDRLRATLRSLASRESLAAVGEFAASLAHEVRNPLSSVRLDLQVAREEIGEGPGAEWVGRALRSVERLDRTVTGALRIARSGKVEGRPIDLVTALGGALHGAEGSFSGSHLRLTRAPPFPESLPMTGDAAALEQVFLNLLLNAAQAGRTEVKVAVTFDADEVDVTIADDGPGIPDDLRDRIFEPFFTTRDEGTGLGLPVARVIVEAHGGTLDVEEVEEGACIRIRLPRHGSRP